MNFIQRLAHRFFNTQSSEIPTNSSSRGNILTGTRKGISSRIISIKQEKLPLQDEFGIITIVRKS